jgi:hypothetical protein
MSVHPSHCPPHPISFHIPSQLPRLISVLPYSVWGWRHVPALGRLGTMVVGGNNTYLCHDLRLEFSGL